MIQTFEVRGRPFVAEHAYLMPRHLPQRETDELMLIDASGAMATVPLAPSALADLREALQPTAPPSTGAANS